MQIARPWSGLLIAAGGVAGGWLLFQWLSPEPSAAQATPAALSQAVPAAVAPQPATPTVIVIPVTMPAQSSTVDVSANRGPGTTVQTVQVPVHVPVPIPIHVPVAVPQLVLAQDGSIIVVGDQANLTANTGDTSSSGAVVLNSQDSTVTSGTSTASGLLARPGSATQSGASPVATTSGASPAATTSGASPAATTSGASPVLTQGQSGSTSIGPVDPTVAALANALALQLTGRPVALAGYEDHSVSVYGNDQIVTYDDSNVFINRNGQLNSNTGDTDSSGLNAVDVVDSVVRSGDHIEDGEDDGEDDGEEEEEPEEEPDEDLTAAATFSQGGTLSQAGLLSQSAGSDTATSTDPDASSTATGRNPLVIGADGYDDVSIRSTGNRNIVTYDDSNVVIGGTGAVNAQIGDSDTSGAVVMGVHGSDVRSGNST